MIMAGTASLKHGMPDEKAGDKTYGSSYEVCLGLVPIMRREILTNTIADPAPRFDTSIYSSSQTAQMGNRHPPHHTDRLHPYSPLLDPLAPLNTPS